MRTAIAALALLLIGSSGALADWQYTRWGMTPEEAVAASGGALKITSKNDKYGNFVTGTHAMRSGTILPARLRFVEGKLAGVSLELKEAKHVGEIRGLLRRAYGQTIYASKPETDCGLEAEDWRSEATNQYIRVSLFRCGSQPSIDGVDIQPILKPGEGGL